MTPDEIRELKELIEFLRENNIGEFDLERGDLKVRIKFAPQVEASTGSTFDLNRLSQLLASSQAPLAGVGQPLVPAAYSRQEGAGQPGAGQPGGAAGTAAHDEPGLHIVKSPIVGTFYESPSPGAPAFVKIGDHVENGQVLCIVEAMKLMNEIESDAAGEVVSRLVSNGQPVEYGQPLFALRSR